MTCKERSAELVECARQETQPDAELGRHLAACPACAERWQTERQLADEFRSMRLLAAGAALVTRDSRRQALLQQFDRRQPVVLLSPARPRWIWTLAAAAAVVVALLVGHEFGVRARPQAPPATRIRALPRPQSILYEASLDAAELSGDDFIAVPYTPPLAEGELVRVIRTELYPEALTSMGIDYDPAAGSNIPAEVVVGEDGLPRAVRITEESRY
jgi:hypothetical protein